MEGYYASEGAINLATWKIRKNVPVGDGIHNWGDWFKTGIPSEMTIVDYSATPFILSKLTGKVTISPDPDNPGPGRASLSSLGWAVAGSSKAL